MKRIFFLFLTALVSAASMMAQQSLELRNITSGRYAPQYLSDITPMPDGESYAQISDDGKSIVQYSFKTGKQTAVLFDVNATNNLTIKDFDGYIMSPDGKKMLIQTNTKRIYRHSFTADYYIYNIASKRLERLSDNGPQQSPVWSEDGLQVAFVRDNNIFLVKLLYDNSESQVTKDGKRNEIINGIPDWVNEEEFGFSTAMTFNADGTVLCWIRYDESRVKTYALQMFKGSYPERPELTTYPGEYSYKYPKAGQENSKVSVGIIQNNKWVYGNRTFCRINGVTHHDIEKLPVFNENIIKRESISLDELKYILSDILNRKQFFFQDNVELRKDGEIYYIREFIYPTSFNNKPAIEVIFLDLTEEKRIEM